MASNSVVVMTQEDFIKRAAVIKEIETPNQDWFPTVSELEKFLELDKSNKKAIENLDFLIWLSSAEQASLPEEKEVQEYVRDLIGKIVTFMPKKDIDKLKDTKDVK